MSDRRTPRVVAAAGREGETGGDTPRRLAAPLSVTLPLPPSTNHLFATFTDRRGSVRRRKTEDYTAWENEAGRMPGWERITEEKNNRIRWRCAIVAYGLPENRDLDNLCKAAIDLVCTMTGLRDRSGNLRGIGVDVADDDPEGTARIVVKITEVVK